MQLSRAVLPARVNASAKLFAIAVLLAGLALGTAIAMLQAALPRDAAIPPPAWRWSPQQRLTHVELGADFTLSTHVRIAPSRTYDPILSNGAIMLGVRGSTFEVNVFERSGQTLRFENTTARAPGSIIHVAITREGSRLSLWVDGNETRVYHDALTLAPERLAVAQKWRARLGEVAIWRRALSARQLAALH